MKDGKWKFLWSPVAIKAHMIFPVAIVGLSIHVAYRGNELDGVTGLLFVIGAYPVILALAWWLGRIEQRDAIEHAVKSITAPEQLRRTRRLWRGGSLIALMILGAGAVYGGYEGWYLDSLPAHYLGYFLIAFAVAGILGINIWWRGPLDPRNDPPPTDGMQ